MNVLMFLSCLWKSGLQTSVTDFKHKSYPNYLRQTVIAIFTLSLVACGGGSDTAVVATPPVGDVTPAPIPDVPQERAVILPGDECATGGIEVSSGGTTEIICDGKDGLDGITALVSQTIVGPGDSCDNGGLRFDVGLDINDNGTLESAEVDSTEFLCTVVIDTAGFEAPSVVSAISVSNTEILLQFSEPMTPSDIENFNNYSVTNVDTKTQLPVWDAVIANQDNSTVLLSTLSQSSVSYLVTATNVRDVDGNAITKPTIADSAILSNPSTTSFVGTDPSGNAIADSDGDTLPDHTELNGWDITITYGNGTTESRRVTSDPGDPRQAVDSAVNIAAQDTDNDGVTDNEERHGGMDPRQPDTDGDTLTDNQEWNMIYSNPSHQDSDGDGTEDGFEFYSYRTSPVLADTDGDQISDTDEVLERNRDPRIADLPLYSIDIGDLRLQIDERYTYEDVDGQTVVNESSSNVTMSFGSSSSKIDGDAQYLQGILDIQGGIQEGSPQKLVQTNWTVGGSQSVDQESATESQRVREESVNKGLEFSTTNTVTREIIGARIDAGVSIENRGDLAFAITNLEVTILQRSRASTRRFIPVATLVANSTLISGEPATFNIGPFTSERGPILFSSRDIFPNLVDQLMQLPPGALVFEVANFDVVDELGRQFTFANQTARDKTASVIIDTGDANIQRKLVATALQPDPDGFGGAAGEFVGGFNGDGSPKGISLDFALQDILELTKNPTLKDGIVAGVNQTADSIASGDDVQLIPAGTTGVSVGSIVISAGQDGILESVASSDDEAEVTTGYETSLTCNVSSDNAGQICSIDSQCSGSAAACSGPERLVRFGSLRNGDFGRQWVVLTTETVLAGADFGRITLKPREDIYLAFVQDLDQDGIFAREEFISGSTDSSADVYDNSSFGDGGVNLAYDLAFDSEGELVGFVIPDLVAVPDGIPDSKDTDRDGLGDFAEIRVGWKVSADGGLLQQVYPSPRLADSDGDGMLDPQEQDLSPFCFDDGSGGGDPRQDALCRFQLEDVVSQAGAISIVAGADGIADSLAEGDDEQQVPQMTNSLTSNTVVISPGNNGVIDTFLSGDDEYESSQSSARITPSSNPLNPDTDADGVDDFAELNGYLIGTNIRDAGDGFAYTLATGDDIQQAFYTGPVAPGGIVILPGPNGTIESVIPQTRNSAGDDELLLIEIGSEYVDCGPNEILETSTYLDDSYPTQNIKPGDNCVGVVLLDRGENGVLDTQANYYDDGEIYSQAIQVVTDPLRRDTDSDLVSDGRERERGGDPTNPLDGEQFRDSDQDGLSDSEESILGWNVNITYFGVTTNTLVLSNPSRTDSDFDGLPDLAERILGTDPNKSDSDNDGISDFDEVADFEQFFGLDLQYPGFFVDGANSMQYGTSPRSTDTDGDGQSDYMELLKGYRLVVPGESEFRQIYTNPLTSDTDKDGVNDSDEYFYTDATAIDTDGDGRSDGVEKSVGTNPLIPDVSITVTYKRLLLDKITDTGGAAGAEVEWYFMVRRPGDSGNGILLSDAADCDFFDVECGFAFSDSTRFAPQFKANSGKYYTLQLGLGRVSPNLLSFSYRSGRTTFTLSEGQSFSVNGIIYETDIANVPKAGLPPIFAPPAITGGCITRFDETFRYSDFTDGGQASFPFPDGANTAENCDWVIEVEVQAH